MEGFGWGPFFVFGCNVQLFLYFGVCWYHLIPNSFRYTEQNSTGISPLCFSSSHSDFNHFFTPQQGCLHTWDTCTDVSVDEQCWICFIISIRFHLKRSPGLDFELKHWNHFCCAAWRTGVSNVATHSGFVEFALNLPRSNISGRPGCTHSMLESHKHRTPSVFPSVFQQFNMGSWLKMRLRRPEWRLDSPHSVVIWVS